MIKLLNGEFETFTFSGGEVHIRVLHVEAYPEVLAILRTAEDVMCLLMLADALRRKGEPVITEVMKLERELKWYKDTITRYQNKYGDIL